jgi:hypothetical protein
MKKELYLHSQQREYHKGQIKSFSKFYKERIFPTFVDIDKEAEKYGENLYEYSEWSSEDIDPASFAEFCRDKGLSYYLDLSKFHYHILCSAVSFLYFLWEQQNRFYLIRECRYHEIVKGDSFCRDFEEIKKKYASFGLKLEDLPSWTKIDELRLLVNAIKHGKGRSSEKLKLIAPRFFIIPYSTFEFNSDTTLLESQLQVQEEDFDVYTFAAMSFWDELPERSELEGQSA